MSMCLYIARGAEARLRELAEDAESLCGMGLDSMFGGPGGASGPAAGQSTQDKLARLEALVAQQPHLRQALDQVMTMVGPQRQICFHSLRWVRMGWHPMRCSQ